MNPTIEYNGHTITVTTDYRFAISGPTIEKDDHRYDLIYESLAKAKERIDERIKQTERQARQKMSIPMLDGDGNPVTITGIHGGNYSLLGIKDAVNVVNVYPRTDAVRALLIEHKKLEERQKEIRSALGSVSISRISDYGVRSYDDALARFNTRLTRVTAAAAKLEKPE